MSLFVAGAVFGEVQVTLFVAGAIFGKVKVSLFVAGAVFGEVQVSLFVAGAVFGVIFFSPMPRAPLQQPKANTQKQTNQRASQKSET